MRLTPKSPRVHEETSYDHESGFPFADWMAIRRFAMEAKYTLLFRSGKSSAIRWLELGYPSKPLRLKAKVDVDLGVLRVEEKHRRSILNMGYWLLEETGAHIWSGVDGNGGIHAVRLDSRWLDRDVVIDPRSRLPFTTDYDLAAAFFAPRGFDHAISVMSDRGTFPGADYTNATIAGVRQNLNLPLGHERIQHGSQAQYQATLTDRADESVLCFAPNGSVQRFEFDLDRHHCQLVDVVWTLFRQRIPLH